MRKGLTLLIAVAAVAFAGTALALTGYRETKGENHVTETTIKEEVIIPVDKPAASEQISDEDREDFKPPRREVADREPVDDTPPAIEILFPEDGQVFEHREVVFEGTTEPGAKVVAGDREADVSEDGSWRLVLVLSPGEQEVKVKAIDEAENKATASITVSYHQPEKPKSEEPKKEEPKQEEPKQETPKEEVVWEFSANQSYGACRENPPYDVFYGTGKPGSTIVIESEYGRKTAEVGEKGGWEVKVIFEGAPLGEAFAVFVVDEFGHQKVFEFVHTD